MIIQNNLNFAFGKPPEVKILTNCILETSEGKKIRISDVYYFNNKRDYLIYEVFQDDLINILPGSSYFNGYFVSADYYDLNFYANSSCEITGLERKHRKKIIGVLLEKNYTILPYCYHKFQAIKIMDI